MRRNVERVHGGGYIINGNYVQTDWDFPPEANHLGWSLTRVQKRNGTVKHLSRRSTKGCDHSGTDGTVDCRDCGITASNFISAAAEYLDSLC